VAGNAAAEFLIKVSGFPEERFVLNTYPNFEQEIEIYGAWIRLLDVKPEPISTRQISSEEYSVRLTNRPNKSKGLFCRNGKVES